MDHAAHPHPTPSFDHVQQAHWHFNRHTNLVVCRGAWWAALAKRSEREPHRARRCRVPGKAPGAFGLDGL